MSVRDAILNVLDSNPDLILDLTSEFPADKRDAHLVAGKWSAIEQVAHLARVDDMMLARLDEILACPEQQVAPYNPENDNPNTLKDENWDDVRSCYRTSRTQLVESLRQVSEDSWRRTVLHPEYPQYSLHIMTRHLALHDAFHGYRIEELLALTLSN